MIIDLRSKEWVYSVFVKKMVVEREQTERAHIYSKGCVSQREGRKVRVGNYPESGTASV